MLFGADTKFDSGTGWPSFTEPAVAEAVELRPDNSLFMRRTEVVCRTCGGHLGHVFDDGPGPDRAALLHQLGRARSSSRPRRDGRRGPRGDAAAAAAPSPAPSPTDTLGFGA